MVPIVQLVRASDCGSECRGFESHWAPSKSLAVNRLRGIFCLYSPLPSRDTHFFDIKGVSGGSFAAIHTKTSRDTGNSAHQGVSRTEVCRIAQKSIADTGNSVTTSVSRKRRQSDKGHQNRKLPSCKCTASHSPFFQKSAKPFRKRKTFRIFVTPFSSKMAKGIDLPIKKRHEDQGTLHGREAT